MPNAFSDIGNWNEMPHIYVARHDNVGDPRGAVCSICDWGRIRPWHFNAEAQVVPLPVSSFSETEYHVYVPGPGLIEGDELECDKCGWEMTNVRHVSSAELKDINYSRLLGMAGGSEIITFDEARELYLPRHAKRVDRFSWSSFGVAVAGGGLGAAILFGGARLLGLF